MASPNVNYVTNPSFETDSDADGRADSWEELAAYTTTGGVPDYSLVPGRLGGLAQRIQLTAGAGDSGETYALCFLSDVGTFADAEAIAASLYARGAASGVTCKLYIDKHNAAGAILGGASTTITPSGSWTRPTVAYPTAKTGTSRASIWLYVTGIDAGDSFDITLDDAQIEEAAAATAYFDGSYGDGYTWAGAAHASASVYDPAWTAPPTVPILTRPARTPAQSEARTVSVVVGSGADAVDLVAEGLTRASLVVDSDCEHGFESAEFPVFGRPHIRAHNALAVGAPVKVLRGGKTTFEGEVVTLSEAAAPHAVECAGIYDQLGRRADYALGVVEGRWDLWQQIPNDLTGTSANKLSDQYTVDTDGQLLIVLPNGTTYKDGQYTQQAIEILPGWGGSCGISRAVFTIDADPGSNNEFTYGFSTSLDAIDLTADLVGTISAVTSETYDIDVAALGSGKRVMWARMKATADATTSADRYVQVRDLQLYIDRVTAPRPDEIIAEIATGTGLCAASDTEALGSAVSQFMADPHTTRAQVIEAARALYAGIMDVGVWDSATVHVRARPTSPPDRARWICLTRDDLVDPDSDWGIVPDDEAGIDAICAAYEHVSVNELAAVAACTFVSTTWPATWTRSTTTNVTVYDSGGYKLRVKSNATERNPWALSAPTPVTGGVNYRARLRASVGAYPNGTAYIAVAWYDAADTLLSTSTLKSWTAASSTEAWYEKTVAAPATAAFARVKVYWSGVTTGASVYSIYARDLSLRRAITDGAARSVYYPAAPVATDARVEMLELGSATAAEAAAAAEQVYLYSAQLATGSVPLDAEHLTRRYGSAAVPTVDGGLLAIDHIRSWDWVQLADALDAEARGPFMLSRVERDEAGVVIEVGGDYWEHPGFAHGEAGRGRYVGGRYQWKRYRKRVKKTKKNRRGWKWARRRVWVEGHY